MGRNVKVDTKISSSKSVGDAIGYTIEGKPHNNNNGKIKKRAVMIRGLNVSDNPHIAKIEMNDTLSKAGIHKNNVHCLREIKSYKFLNYHSKRDRQLGMKLDLEMMQKEHPHCQILAVMHIDGVHHHIHIHNIICAIDPITMRSITHRQTSWTYHLRPITDKIMAQNGFPNQSTNLHSPKKRSRNVIYHIKKGDSWVKQVQDKLDYARFHATNSLNYIQLVKQQGIGIECFKMHTVNGKREIHFYKNPSKSPKIIQHRVINGKHKGEFVHERKHFSYDIRYHGKKYKIRDKKLGSDFSKHNLLRQFQLNRQQQLHPSFKVASNNRPIRSNLKQSRHLKPVLHQQSNDVQPVMIHTKDGDRAKNDTGSIKHSLKPSSVARANKLTRYVHMDTFTVPMYTKRATKSKSGMIIPLHYPEPVKARSFHFPVIHLPNKPSMPIFQFLNASKDTEENRAIESWLESNKMDQYRKSYDDYMSIKDARSEAIDANRDMDSSTRATNMDTAKDAHEKHLMLIKEIRARNNGVSR